MRQLLALLPLLACAREPAIGLAPTKERAVDVVTPGWEQIPTSDGPAARTTQMVFDTARNRIVLFGGFGDPPGSGLDDTWIWNGSAWTELQPKHRPPARAAAAMVYDAARDRVVLFGGARPAGGVYGDTWEFDGADWVEAHPAVSPSPRWSPAFAWDATNQRTTLFSGWIGDGSGLDTWSYDGRSWELIADAGGPGKEGGYPIATFDPRTGRTAMLTDEIVDGQSVAHLWWFDGLHWTEQALSVLPSHPGQTVLGSHSTYGLVQYGGIGDGGRLWTFDGATPHLRQLIPAPAAVNAQALVSDPAQGRLLLFGGGGEDGRRRDELWELR